MLLHLHVKNLALIRETEIEFTEGLNILTGETGAGKSIIIGSITMALGGKAAREMLRGDADSAFVELVFSVGNQPRLRERLLELDIPMEEDELILSRKITGSRSICRLNGVTVSTSIVREISSFLIDIHGQHEHQSLLNKKKHLEILDAYAHERLLPVKEKLAGSFRLFKKLEKEKKEAAKDEDARLREQSLLEYEIGEITDAALKDGEDEKLEHAYRKMSGGKRILESLGLVQMLCTQGDTAVSEQLGRACRELSGAVSFDEELKELDGQLQQIDSELQDFLRELADYMEGLEFSGQEFADVEERLNLVNHLKAKYGPALANIAAYQKEKQRQLDILVNYEQYMQKLEEDYRKAREDCEAACLEVHRIRAEAAAELAVRMREQLAELNFLDVKFEISVEKTGQFTADGFDDVEFLISTNPGEPLKALGKIASGGELSRVMLAIKTVLADQDAIDTVIFDEIDAGISGRTAQRVSEKLALIGQSRQVICITHLAQLASMADGHYCIEKHAKDGGTTTNIRRLDENEVTEELARILGGAQITDAVRENAQEMRHLAAQFKHKLAAGKNWQ